MELLAAAVVWDWVGLFPGDPLACSPSIGEWEGLSSESKDSLRSSRDSERHGARVDSSEFFKLRYATISYRTLICVKVPVTVLIAIGFVGYGVE